jgi:hypothetical protein
MEDKMNAETKVTRPRRKPAEAPKEQEYQPTMYERLAAPFPPSCIEWRAQQVTQDGKRAMALAYIDARSVMARLDEVVGPQNWQDSYRFEHDRTFGELKLRIDGEWISKSDTSDDSNFEGAKGGASGAFKRAGVKWGIGRYLYDVEAVWADCESYPQERNGKRTNVFKKWTDAGTLQLQRATQQAPGPRSTGKPVEVDMMMDKIRAAKTIPELRKIHQDHFNVVPMEYRKEVLDAEYIRKGELEREDATKKKGDNK